MKKIANLLFFAGIVVLVGSAGSSDLGQLSIKLIMQNCLLGVIFIVAGVILKSFKISAKHCKVLMFSAENSKNIKFPV